MEIRKVQITGGATFMVTLPKDWAEAQKLRAGDPLEIHRQPSGALIVQPHRPSKPSRGILELNGLSGIALKRAFISMYIAGYDIIEVQGERISSEQLQTIREVTRALLGLGVVDDTSQTIVVQNLTHSAELAPPKVLERIFSISHKMFGDALSALVEHNLGLARNVTARDEDIDQLFLMLSRQFRIALRDLLAEDQLGLSRLRLFEIHSVARQLERVADHAVKIARVTTSLKEKLPGKVAEALQRAGEPVAALLKETFEAFQERSAKRAACVMEKGAELEERLLPASRLLRDLEPHEAQFIGIAFDSVRRTKDYSINIAEMALNASVDLPV
ncbi:phosphate uptake regulator PhoU [Candidatus Acetothermia bacterium]|jgi:phosphate uptake regulator|nr:phosphate uptake regulator PhoU [Candidatus Acetothermia bacterium]MCI2431281.1 phosphate uptake regulator PhoU [Candidatus Acetothermia bacterium]MCI2436262.1 phosphate uptake regulator PhoU [Candidatus Acetothermia bacterium]